MHRCIQFVAGCYFHILHHVAVHLQASLQTENMALAQQQQQQLDMFNSNRPQTSASSNGTSAGGAGLRNATGEYNCFLNVIIQCLWRCQAFRKQIMQWEPQVYQVTHAPNLHFGSTAAFLIFTTSLRIPITKVCTSGVPFHVHSCFTGSQVAVPM